MKKILRPLFYAWKIFPVCWKEYIQLIKSFCSTKEDDEEAKLRNRIYIQSHIIEKGLSLKDVRLGFGVPKVKQLLSYVEKYYNKYKEGYILYFALSVIQKYVEFHKEQDFAVDEEIMQRFNQLMELVSNGTNETTNLYEGGTKQVKREDIIGTDFDFADFIKNYKTDATILGIDVSRWQENIDFNKVKAAGCEFVIIRLGGYDNGELYTDKYYKANIVNAKAAGLKVGIYWHAEESSREEIKASVNYLLGVLGENTLDFPIAYDWEDYINFEQYDMNLRDLTECFYAFAEELQARGYAVCLYGSKNSHTNIWQNDRKYPEWLAHYTSATNYEGDYYMWQHSSTGKIDGINGDVDLDVLYVDKWKKVMGQ